MLWHGICKYHIYTHIQQSLSVSMSNPRGSRPVLGGYMVWQVRIVSFWFQLVKSELKLGLISEN